MLYPCAADGDTGDRGSPLLYALQDRQQEGVELFDRVDVEMLVRRVHLSHRRAERHHVHAGVLLADDAALEARVDRLHRGILAVQGFVSGPVSYTHLRAHETRPD